MNGTLANAECDGIGTGIHKCDVGVRSEADVGLAHLDFGTAIAVSKEAVAGPEREIGIGLAPVVGACRLNGDRAGDGREAPRLGGRVVILRAGGGRNECEADRGCDCQQQFSEGGAWSNAHCRSFHEAPDRFAELVRRTGRAPSNEEAG